MKIYTKSGDKGETSLITGKRVAKCHPRVEAYGTIDELNSFTGLLLALDIQLVDKQFLANIQNTLFMIGSLLACDKAEPDYSLPEISEKDIYLLENEMDDIQSMVPVLKAFILPGGNQAIATAHVCRTVCRRAERLCVRLSETEPVDNHIIIYLNRLSDYFFMLARKIAFNQHIELPVWINRKKDK